MKRLLILLVALVLTAAACSNPVDPYAAKVNGIEIPAEVIDRQVQAIVNNPAYADALRQQFEQNGTALRPGGPNTVNADYVASLVYDRILSVLITQRLERDGITVPAEARQATEAEFNRPQADGQPNISATLDPEYRSYVLDVQSKLNTLIALRSGEEQQRAFYEANKADFEQVCLRQIAAQTQAEAAGYKARFDAGADFATLVRESFGAQQPLDPAGQPVDPAAPQCLLLTEVGQAGRDILNQVPVNGVSAPLSAGGSFLLVNVTSRTAQTFEQVQPQIREQLQDRNALFEELLQDARIEVNPRYGEFRRADPANRQQTGVYPLEPVAVQPAPEREPATSPLG